MKTLIIMGNGPSLRYVDFGSLKEYDTFGLNAAYRKYYEMNWWPTYFGCFDFVVTDSHKGEFGKLFNTNIKKFFFIRDWWKNDKFQYCNISKIGDYGNNDISTSFDDFYDQGNSGTNACQVGIMMGYKKIILLGVDQNYIEDVDGSGYIGGKLQMTKTPYKNPNYWFDDYQQKGDKFNKPQLNTWQIGGWESLSVKSKKMGIDIVNCSPISKLEVFRKGKIEDEL